MVSTFTFLAATLLVGQSSETPPAASPSAYGPKVYVYSNGVPLATHS